MSLYLKYRPQDFKTIVGQAHIISTLKNALKHNSLTHAYLFSGPRGTGKTSLARIIAKSLNCNNLASESEPCNSCENCQAITTGHLVDMIEIDAASNRGIDEIRELREKIQFAPSQGKAKVYIIDEVHMLTKEAFNALLKTLEEPPSHAYFILATTEAHKIPETIISRCQQFKFKRIESQAIVARLQEIATEEKVAAEPDALTLIGKQANGGLRDAIGLFEQMILDESVIYQEVLNRLGVAGHASLEAMLNAIEQKEPLRAIELVASLNAEGHNLKQFCSEWVGYLREQMLLGLNEKKDVSDYIEWIDIFSEAKLQINQAIIPLLPIEIAIIKACGFAVSSKKELPVQEQKQVSPQAVEIKTQAQEVKTEEAKPEVKVPEESRQFSGELTLEGVKEKWQRIVDAIETPFIRMSLVNGEPIEVQGRELHLAFSSRTLMEKVENPNNQNEIMKAFDEVLKTKPSLRLRMKKIELKAVQSEESMEEKKEPASVVDMAKEVFGS